MKELSAKKSLGQNFLKDNNILNMIADSIKTKEEILNNSNILLQIEQAAQMIITAYKNNKKVLTAGNGGSAADAQHICAELVSKFLVERKALNAVALTTNTSILTAVGNDYNNDYIFARQIQAFATEGDVYIAISTSGESVNIIKSIEEARKNGIKVIGLTGNKPCPMDKICDLIIKVPSQKTSIIQESQMMIGHILCAIVEKELFS